MQPLRDEHAGLLPHIEQLRDAADRVAVGAVSHGDIAASLEFLEHHLLPHAIAEDTVLYPAVARLLGSERATDTMRRDHAAVGDLIGQLRALQDEAGSGPLTPEQARDARRLLYGLYTLVRVHFDKEEEVYVPILESALSADEARELYERMEAAAARARGTA